MKETIRKIERHILLFALCVLRNHQKNCDETTKRYTLKDVNEAFLAGYSKGIGEMK